MIKDNNRNKQTEITVVYKDNNTLAYKVFDSRYVTLNQDMSINTEIKGTDPIYLYIEDGSNQQDKEYLKSRQALVAVLDAMNASPKMTEYIAAIAQSEKGTEATDWKTCKAICERFDNIGDKDDVKYIKNVEKSLINVEEDEEYDYIKKLPYYEKAMLAKKRSIDNIKKDERQYFDSINRHNELQFIIDYILKVIDAECRKQLLTASVFAYNEIKSTCPPKKTVIAI